MIGGTQHPEFFGLKLFYFPMCLVSPNDSSLLTGVKIARNKGRHYPFCKSQLDSRTFGVVGSTGLWTRYHSKVFGYSFL